MHIAETEGSEQVAPDVIIEDGLLDVGLVAFVLREDVIRCLKNEMIRKEKKYIIYIYNI